MCQCVCVCVCCCACPLSSCPCVAIKQLVNFSALGTRTRCQLPVTSWRLSSPFATENCQSCHRAQAVCLLVFPRLSPSPYVCVHCITVTCYSRLFSLPNNENSRCTISRGGHRCCCYFQPPQQGVSQLRCAVCCIFHCIIL